MPDFGLVMPFVVCQSQGGPYDDDAFVAGYECGIVDRDLARFPENVVYLTVHAASVPQIDLIAMRHGFTATVRDSEVGGWAYVDLHRVSVDA